MNRILYLRFLERLNISWIRELDTVSGTAEKDKCIRDMNKILYLGLLEWMNVPRI